MSATLDDLAATIGTAGAKALVSMWGGRRLYVPAHPAPGSAIVELLGELMAGRLGSRYGGDTIELPRPDIPGARRIEVHRLAGEGFTLNEIAAQLGLTRRRVRQIFAGD